MKVIDRACPKCKTVSRNKHCTIKANCSWFICSNCSPNRFAHMVFSPVGRYFLQKRDS